MNSFHYVGGSLLQARDPIGLDGHMEAGRWAADLRPRDPGNRGEFSQFVALEAMPDMHALYGGLPANAPLTSTERREPDDVHHLSDAMWAAVTEDGSNWHFAYSQDVGETWQQYDPAQWGRGEGATSEPVGNFMLELIGTAGLSLLFRIGSTVVRGAAVAVERAVLRGFADDLGEAAARGLQEGAEEAVEAMTPRFMSAVDDVAARGRRDILVFQSRQPRKRHRCHARRRSSFDSH